MSLLPSSLGCRVSFPPFPSNPFTPTPPIIFPSGAGVGVGVGTSNATSTTAAAANPRIDAQFLANFSNICSHHEQTLIVAVEYPGHVENVAVAIQKLKGEETLRKTLNPSIDSLLKLHYRSNDPLAHPLHGEVNRSFLVKPLPPTPTTAARRADQSQPTGEHTFDFVIKVNKKKKKNIESQKERANQSASALSSSSSSSSSSSLSAELIGQVCTSVSFQGLSDFQLIAPPSPEIDVDIPQLWPSSVLKNATTVKGGQATVPDRYIPNRAGDCLLSPLLFSRYDYPRDYNFVNHDNSSTAVKAAERNTNATPTLLKVQPRMGSIEEDDKKSRLSQSTPISALQKKRPRDEATTVTGVGSITSALMSAADDSNNLEFHVDEEDPNELSEEEDGEEEGEGEGEGEGDDIEGDGDGESELTARRRRSRSFYIKYYEKNRPPPSIPTGPDPSLPFADAAFQSKFMVQHLKKHFRTRPIWSTDALVVKLDADHTADPTIPLISRQSLLSHLVAVGFRFSGGPWRNLWIRYGYDPRLRDVAQEARMLEVIDYRLNRRQFDLIHGHTPINASNNNPTSATSSSQLTTQLLSSPLLSHSPIPSPSILPSSTVLPSDVLPSANLTAALIDIGFERMPTRLHSSFQVIDLPPPIQSLVRSSSIPAVCSRETGWMTLDAMSQVRMALHNQVMSWCVQRGIPGTEFEALLDVPEKNRSKHRRSLGREFAIERKKARGMTTLRKSKSAPKKKDGSSGGVGSFTFTPAKKKAKMSDAVSGLSQTAIQAASNVVATLTGKDGQDEDEKMREQDE